MIRGVVLGIAIAMLIAGCVVHRLMGPRLTGTCDGACAHYIECKPGHPQPDASRCRAECPDVFSDSDSLMAYESLSCNDAVEFIDGRTPKAATAKPR
ncbi:MAG TPA: hypothetical protein VFQ53_22010 [Kofleriaceae bacterium]|nr:hypothetical protein [Kofleriaceae bacterium]